MGLRLILLGIARLRAAWNAMILIWVGSDMCKVISDFRLKLTNSHIVSKIKNLGHGKIEECARNTMVIIWVGFNVFSAINGFG